MNSIVLEGERTGGVIRKHAPLPRATVMVVSVQEYLNIIVDVGQFNFVVCVGNVHGVRVSVHKRQRVRTV